MVFIVSVLSIVGFLSLSFYLMESIAFYKEGYSFGYSFIGRFYE